MTTSTALAILKGASLKPHLLVTKSMPPSHGDPGGWPYVTQQCPALTLDVGNNIVSVNESACTCGASKQNFLCNEALVTLHDAIKPSE